MLLTDAWGDSQRATDLADMFTARVISILPERWTMTQTRVVSYADLMGRELLEDSLAKARGPVRALNHDGNKSITVYTGPKY